MCERYLTLSYDLAGNRERRTVRTYYLGSLQGVRRSEYTYDPATDRLLTEEIFDDEYTARVFGTKDSPLLARVGADGITYSSGGNDLSGFAAFMRGLPTKYSWLSYLCAMLAIPALFVSGAIIRRHSMSRFNRGVALVLIWLFILGPGTLPLLADTASDYTGMLNRWGYNNSVITYNYDNNGSLTSKITDAEGTENDKTVSYAYNLQGRLETVTTVDTGDTSTVEYRYNSSGIRTAKIVDGIETEYLIDSSNHTGYSQVLEEWVDTDGSGPAKRALDMTYTIGDDVVAQTDSSNNINYLLYDGHGSTRQLLDSSGVAAVYDYDSYGIGTHSDETSGATTLQYTGEIKDSETDDYYLRARYYSPSNGRFNRVDPYAGNTQDPQSLHKYLYCHANPVNYLDPTGEMALVNISFSTLIGSIMTSISTLSLTAYMWAATNMALITSVSYYAMWTFILSSIWVGMEEADFIPEVTLVGDITVAKGLQIVSGSAFFLGLMIMGTVPDMERVKLARQVQTRAYELRKSYPYETHKRMTMGVGIAQNKSGERVTLIATSENTSQGLYTRPGVTLKANEIMVSGKGHAEQRIVEFCKQTNLRLLTITATRKVCEPICVPAITPTGADIVAPISDKDIGPK